MKKKLFIFVAVVALLAGIVGCFFTIKNRPDLPKEDPDSKRVTSVQGVAFTIPRSISNQATAITQIADNLSFSDSAYYSYNNGNDEYMLFNISRLVILAQKNTDFHFSEQEDKEAALDQSGIMGVWFEKSGKNFNCENSGNKTTAIVNAGVSITSEVYGDFTGKMATLEQNDEEWSIFAGVPGEKYSDLDKEIKSALDEIVDSFELSDNPMEEPETYEIVLSGNAADEKEPVSVSEGEVSPVSVPEEESVSANRSISENQSVSADRAVSENQSVSENIPSDVVTITEMETVSENVTDTISGDNVSQNTILENKTEEEVKETISNESAHDTKDKKTPSPRSNQKKTSDRSDEKAYSSDIYSMLKIPSNGILDAVTKKGEIEKVVIRVNKVLSKEVAEKEIRDYCNREECGYNYFDAPAGCHWEAVSYDLLYREPDTRPYVNIRLRGADGDNLKYRGVRYSPKTHDIFSKTEEETTQDGIWVKGNICYYAVPNGCEEYVLECGDGKVDSEYPVTSAYYLVDRNY